VKYVTFKILSMSVNIEYPKASKEFLSYVVAVWRKVSLIILWRPKYPVVEYLEFRRSVVMAKGGQTPTESFTSYPLHAAPPFYPSSKEYGITLATE